MNNACMRFGLIGLLLLAASGCARDPGASPAMLRSHQDSPPSRAEDFGSTRHSVVAYPMPAGRRESLIFLAGAFDQATRDQLREVAPNVTIIGDLTRESAMKHAAQAHGIDVRLLSPEFLQAAPNLCWVMGLSAGVDRYMSMKPLVDNDRIVLTNMRAVHGPAIADHAMAMLLSLTRNLEFYRHAQNEGRWEDRDQTPRASTALAGKTMLIVGIGGIGEEMARRAHGFGMRIIATRRSDAPTLDFVERVGKPDELAAMIGEADVVTICTPLTAETRNLFNASMFEAMKKGSYLINIARGAIVNTDALMEALRSGQLAGACLDVTDPEPLSEGHPLWKMPNVIITPHVAADAEVTRERSTAMIIENMRRFGAGEPLLNVVDKVAGY